MLDKPFGLSVKAIVRDDKGRQLVIRRSKTSSHNAGSWDFPGGKLDPGEDFVTALLREVREETGLEVRLTGVAGHAEAETENLRVAYLIMDAELTSGSVRLSSEHDLAQWLTVGELSGLPFCPQFETFLSTLKAR